MNGSVTPKPCEYHFLYEFSLEISGSNDISRGSNQISISKSVNRRRYDFDEGCGQPFFPHSGKDWWFQCLISILGIAFQPYIVDIDSQQT